MSRDITPFGLRMPPELKAKLEEAAKAAGRSLNAEIVARLEASIPANVEDEVRASRESDLAKLRASHQLVLGELSEYRERMRVGETGPYGPDWLREVIDQCVSRAERLERMIYRAERELEALEADSAAADTVEREISEREARISDLRRRVQSIKAAQASMPSRERDLTQNDIAYVEASIANWESELTAIKEQLGKGSGSVQRAAKELRRSVEQSDN